MLKPSSSSSSKRDREDSYDYLSTKWPPEDSPWPSEDYKNRERECKKKRRSRWVEDENKKVFIPGLPTVLPNNLNPQQEKAYLLQLQIEEIHRCLRTRDLGISPNPEERSPSPEPIYDSEGCQLNTRENRTRKKLADDRNNLIQELYSCNPEYKPTPEPVVKVSEKVMIPQVKHPDVNFVGLIIGPRGNTIKTLETQTGAKIFIRSEKSVKVSKFGEAVPGENETLHALITGYSNESVKKAVEKIREIIHQAVELPEGENKLRKMQLRELAVLNGMVRKSNGSCSTKSEATTTTHNSWQCTDKPNIMNNSIFTNFSSTGHIKEASGDHKTLSATGTIHAPDKATISKGISSSMFRGGQNQSTMNLLPPSLMSQMPPAIMSEMPSQIDIPPFHSPSTNYETFLTTQGGTVGMLTLPPLPSLPASAQQTVDTTCPTLTTIRKKVQLQVEEINRRLAIRDLGMSPNPQNRQPDIKVSERVMIPQLRYPEINFPGLLIGPRGNTLKSVEKETGTKIYIHNDESLKEDYVESEDGQPLLRETLYALVTGYSNESIKKAADKIREIMHQAVELPEEENKFRRMQQQELAVLNSTLKLNVGSHSSNRGANTSTHNSLISPDERKITTAGTMGLPKEMRAKIFNRSEGSVKDSKEKQREGQPLPKETLQTLVTSYSDKCINNAINKIRELIHQGVEVSEEDIKLQCMQLPELAALNTTLSENDRSCSMNNSTATTTRNSWRCTNRIITNNVICSNCGSVGHIAMDCHNYKTSFTADTMAASYKDKTDKEITSLMFSDGQNKSTSTLLMPQDTNIQPSSMFLPPPLMSQMPSPVMTQISLPVMSQAPLPVMSQTPLSVMSQTPLSVMSQTPLSVISQMPLSVISQMPPPVMSQMPPPVMSQIPSSVMSQIPSSVMSQMPPPVMSQMPPPVMSQIPSSVMSQIPSSVMSQIPSSVMSQMPSSVMSQMPSSVMSRMPSSVMSQMQSSVLSQMQSSVMSQMSSFMSQMPPPSTMSQTSASTMSQMPPPSTMSQTPASTMSQMPSPVMSHISSAVMSQIPTHILSQITPLAISQFPSALMSQIAPSVISQFPSAVMSQIPSAVLSQVPSAVMSQVPSAVISQVPSAVMSQIPSAVMSQIPSAVMSQIPSAVMSQIPSAVMSQIPSDVMPQMPLYQTVLTTQSNMVDMLTLQPPQLSVPANTQQNMTTTWMTTSTVTQGVPWPMPQVMGSSSLTVPTPPSIAPIPTSPALNPWAGFMNIHIPPPTLQTVTASPLSPPTVSSIQSMGANHMGLPNLLYTLPS